MEIVEVREDLPRGDLPDKDINHLGFTLGCHLPSGYNVFTRVQGHAHHVFFM